MPPAKVGATIHKVRDLIFKNRNDIKNFCKIINRCSLNQSQRYVLYTVDSIYDGVHFDFAPSLEHTQTNSDVTAEVPIAQADTTLVNAPRTSDIDSKTIIRTLFKIPRAVYTPKFPDAVRPGPDFCALLDKELEKWDPANRSLQDVAKIVSDMHEMVEFISEHSIDVLVGPLRPSALRLLESYKHALLHDTRHSKVKILMLATELLHVLKIHSIDSEDLQAFILNMLTASPTMLKQCNVSTLEHLSRMKLPESIRSNFENVMQSHTTKYMSMNDWAAMFAMVSRTSDNRAIIDCFIHGYKILARNMRRDLGDEPDLKTVSTITLRNAVGAISTLHKRLRPSDPLYKNATRLLESLWPLVESRRSRFNPVDLINITGCYIRHHGEINPQVHNGGRNCLDILIQEIHRRSGDFLLRDWVSLFEVLDTARDVMVVNVLRSNPGNYYIKMATIQRAWIEDVATMLQQQPLEQLADNIYSLSFPQCATFCKHLVAAGCYTDALSATIERRCLALITDLKYHTSRHVLDFHFLQLQMVLPPHNPLRSVLQSNKSTRDMLSHLSSDSLLRLLDMSPICNLADTLLLLQQLTSRIEANALKPSAQTAVTIMNHALRYKDANLVNAVLAVSIPPILQLEETQKGFCKLLDLSKYALRLPKSGSDITPATALNDFILERAIANVPHLGLTHLDLLLQNLYRSTGGYSPELMEAILSHALEIDLLGISLSQVSSMISTLSKLGIRHDLLLDRLEQALLMSLIEDDGNRAADCLISVGTSLAHLGVRSQKLNELYENILDGSPVAISNWDYDSLSLSVRIGLVHAISVYGVVNDSLEKRFIQLVQQSESTIKNGNNSVSFAKVDPETYRKLYDIYISLLVTGPPGMDTNAIQSEFLLEHLPCYHWFRQQEGFLADFKQSPRYSQLKGALRQLGLDNAEPRVTEAYFVHMVLDSPDCEAVLGAGNKIVYFVPPEDELVWWTPRSEESQVANKAEPHQHIIGQSNRVIDHLQRSGWVVVPVFLRLWDSLESDARLELVANLLRIKSVQL
ncbi:hypothetical protein BaOVIS_023240 [Babesia ovis]|uniref:RAP domain-containing protein n=1 Tax=Babesia ovis TaxID=5869 RepID=A0A9W5TCE4_BABOV|nr:hypothetical protein BaOVIS_023240 [Babesia ovis]